MPLSSDLVSQFVKITKDNKRTKTETTVYGTIVNYSGSKYVRLDGSDLLTPVTMTVDAEAGERVTVRLKNHTATVTGNITSPAARVETVKVVVDSVTDVENIVANTVTTEVLNVERARITALEADNVTINNKVTANSADIEILKAGLVDVDYLDADYAQFKIMTADKFTALDGTIGTLQTGKLDATTASATYATIANLEATNANITTLQTTKLSASDIEGLYANIDFSNISKATMGQFYANSGLIQNVIVGDATISGRLIGVTISGDLIEAGTIIADRLVIQGEDGLYYALNTDGMTVEAQQTTYNSINGQLIQAHSITASKITVSDLVAFGATIGGFHISNDSLYSGVKSSPTNTTRGIYLDKDGQAAFGNASNFIKFYDDANGVYKLEISADTIKFNNSGTMESVATAISTVKTTADNANSIASVARVNANDAKTAANEAQTATETLDGKVTDLQNYMLDAETRITQNGNAIALRATKTELSNLENRVTSAESSITILANQITSNVSETTNLGTRMSTVEQTADGLTTRLGTAENDVTSVRSIANSAKATATNFLSFDTTNGVLIGNKASGSWSGTRAQIKSSEFNILDSSGTVLSSYGSTTTIGKTAGNNIYINTNGIYVRKNGKTLATFDQYGLKIANTNDATGSLGSGTTKPALVIGTPTGYHIEMDNNEIMAKSNATTSSHLFLNMEGGNVSVNNNANRAFMFQEGALYAKNASYNSGKYLGIIDALNDAGNTVFGYGGYINKIGGTNLYGNSISLVSNGDINVEASWIKCRSIAPNEHATYALGVYGEKGWSNIYLGKGDNKTNALHIISGSSTYTLCGVNSSGQYIFGNNAAVMYYQVKNVNETTTGNAFKVTSGNNDASNNTSSVWLFGAADATSRYIGSYLAYNRTYSSAANMVVTSNGVFGRSTSSSERYKRDIELASIDDVKLLYELPVKKFKYKNDYIAQDDELYDKNLYGFIVEDLETAMPCAVQHITDDNGNIQPEMWNSNIIVPSLLKLIQDLNNRVKALEAGG